MIAALLVIILMVVIVWGTVFFANHTGIIQMDNKKPRSKDIPATKSERSNLFYATQNTDPREWHRVVIAMEGVEMPDHRMIEPGAIEWRDAEVPLVSPQSSFDVIGMARSFERKDALITAEVNVDTEFCDLGVHLTDIMMSQGLDNIIRVHSGILREIIVSPSNIRN